MRSDAHQRLHTTFAELEIGDNFQFVNSVMGTVVPGSITLKKISESSAESEQTGKAEIRLQSEVRKV